MIKGVVLGQCPSKSNSYKIIKIGKKYSLGKTKKLREYENSFILQTIKLRNLLISKEFRFEVNIYYDSKRPDLDNSFKAILDCLQKIKCVKNDNLCVEVIGRKYKDKNNPRIEFSIVELDSWDYEKGSI